MNLNDDDVSICQKINEVVEPKKEKAEKAEKPAKAAKAPAADSGKKLAFEGAVSGRHQPVCGFDPSGIGARRPRVRLSQGVVVAHVELALVQRVLDLVATEQAAPQPRSARRAGVAGCIHRFAYPVHHRDEVADAKQVDQAPGREEPFFGITLMCGSTRVTEILARSNAQRMVVVLDSCFSGKLPDGKPIGPMAVQFEKQPPINRHG